MWRKRTRTGLLQRCLAWITAQGRKLLQSHQRLLEWHKLSFLFGLQPIPASGTAAPLFTTVLQSHPKALLSFPGRATSPLFSPQPHRLMGNKEVSLTSRSSVSSLQLPPAVGHMKLKYCWRMSKICCCPLTVCCCVPVGLSVTSSAFN